MFHVEPRGEKVAIMSMGDGKVSAIGRAFGQWLPAAWRDATRGGRAVVLAGNAKAFGAGLDLKALPSLPEGERAEFADMACGARHPPRARGRQGICVTLPLPV